ncbi:MAG TPA: xanthine dehydrogenase family protein molybdopterin-binding subunit [Gemmataceae bacterium]|nr:xanthine dehydrogenase family protein molybdopterin-binding subunit [Gemmataceae bacterium]
MATWPKERRVLSTKVPRLDGPDKATGRAKYTYDINRPGMLHAKILRCPHAHAILKSLDTSAAEKMPGVAAIHLITKPGTELFFAGTEILALAADTEEHALDAIRAVKTTYDVLPHLVREEDALNNRSANTVGGKGNVFQSNQDATGNVDDAFAKADKVVEGTYGIPVIAHQCLEAHGLVAEWSKDGDLTVWCSTQATTGVAGQLATALKVPANKVRCITHYMGGGFGSKFQPGVEGIAAAELARKTGKPVKLMLDRDEEVTTAGTRPSAYGRVKIGGTKDGKIIAFEAHCYGSPGMGTSAGVRFNELPYVYSDAIPNIRKDNLVVRLNCAPQRAWRAPGHPQSCIMTEWPIDDLAAALNMDPMQLRLKNLPPSPPGAGNTWQGVREKLYAEEIKIAARLAEWDKKWHPPGKGPTKGPIKHGIGMALHTWGGAGRANNDITITISSDGSVLLESSTQDLGTGERTVLAIVAAEVLGLEPRDITVRIGESQYGRSTGSGGSTTTPGTAPAALNAATAARDALLDKLAPRLNAQKENLAIAPGKIVDRANKKEWAWKEACARLGMDVIVGKGDWTPGLSSGGVCGVQIAEVQVDTETGVVRCTRIVAVQDCGLMINKQGCESQVAGGVTMGLNPALWEERIMDSQTGRQLNPDMEFYKLAGIKDMPEIIVHMMDMPERGVIGIGEPPTISTTAAIGNAVFNALGVRVPYAPFTPDRVLAALAQKGGKG